jgi:hypothetical protein
MPVSGKRYKFSKENVDKSPRQSGVFALYDGETVIFIGRATDGGVTLRSALQDHQAGRGGSATQRATHYRREQTKASVSREIELLAEHAANFGGQPRENMTVA